MRQEAVNTNNKPTATSVTLGRWLSILWKFGVKTPADQIGNEEVDLILDRLNELRPEPVEGLAREKEKKDVR